MSAGTVAAAIVENAAAANVPQLLMTSTIQAANLFASSPAGAAGAISQHVVALTEGVLRSMLLTKFKTATAYCLALVVLTGGIGLSLGKALAASGPRSASLTEVNPDAPEETPKAESKPPQHAEVPAPDKGIHGSGKAITKELQLAGFATIEVSRAFQVELIRADSFHVTITSDDNLMPFVRSSKDGSTLRLSIDPNLKSFWATSLKATIAMPALERLRMASGSRVTMKGFKSTKPFQASIAYSGVLTGEIEAPSVDLDIAGGGRVTLKGSTKELKISAAQRQSEADL